MSFADQSLITDPNSNYFSFQARKYNEGKIPDPSEIISGSSHIVVIDSRERDRNYFPNSAHYSLRLPQPFKNVTSVELKGTVLPKTEYNVNSENNRIVYNVEDFITSIQITDPGDGYVDGVYGFGAVPPNDTLVAITPPGITGGTTADITVTVADGLITSIVIVDPGEGYLRGFYGSSIDYAAEGYYRNAGASFVNLIPFEQAANPRRRAQVTVEVGHELVATLNEGQYDFANPNDLGPGLCREVTRALQASIDEAIADGIITPAAAPAPQTGAQYFPYSVLDSSDGSCYLFTPNPNASENSNVAIQRGADDGTFEQNLFLELLWGKSSYQDSNSMTLLGYGSSVIPTLPDTPLDQTSGELGVLANPWVSAPIESRHNYCLMNFPKYCILSFGQSTSDSTDRIESTNETLDKAFATLVFDANTPDVIFRAPTAAPVAGEGDSDYSTLLFKPGTLKGIKGADFDTKVLSFGPSPLAELKGISIRFQKFNGDPYDFKGQDHLLIFQINANDINSGNRW